MGRHWRQLGQFPTSSVFASWYKERVWNILRISIWDPTVIYNSNWHFSEVPLNVTIEFENIDWLMGFLENIEKKIIDTAEDRILYKVQAVTYDIIANDEPQTTDIEIIAYYYYDEKFDKVEEENNEENTEANNEENNNSESISDIIKNS